MKNLWVTYKVQHVDIDADNVVHFSRYTSLAEAACLEYFYEKGIDLNSIKKDGLNLIVRKITANYIAPTFHQDILLMQPVIKNVSSARINMQVLIKKDNNKNTNASIIDIEYVFFNTETKKPAYIPKTIKSAILGTFE